MLNLLLYAESAENLHLLAFNIIKNEDIDTPCSNVEHSLSLCSDVLNTLLTAENCFSTGVTENILLNKMYFALLKKKAKSVLTELNRQLCGYPLNKVYMCDPMGSLLVQYE